MADREPSIDCSSQPISGHSISPLSTPMSPGSNFSRPTSIRSISHSRPAVKKSASPAPPSRQCSISYDNGTGVVSEGVQNEIRQTGKLPTNVRRTASLQALLNNKSLQEAEAGLHRPAHERDSFTLSDVPASYARPERAAFVRSMVASTHNIAPSMQSRISDVQDPDDDWWDRDLVEAEAALLNLLKPQVRMATPTNEQTSFTSKPLTLSEHSTSSSPSGCFRPSHSRENSETSIRSNETRRFHYPIPPSKPPSPTFPLTLLPPPHPSTAILLESRSPSVRRLILERPNLLTALETTRALPPPTKHCSSAPLPPWYVTWPTASSTLPLHRRTLLTLRTSNLPRHPTSVTSPHSTDGGGAGGQLTHFARAVPFRWTKATRARGPQTDYAHPSFAGSVAGSRALWIAGYREANYRDVGALSRSGTEGSDCYASRAADPVSGLAGRGREMRVWKWEGHWLRRGGMRGLKIREERVGEVAAVVQGKEEVESSASEGKLGSWRKVLGRVGSDFSEKGEKLPKKQQKKQEGSKRYTPLPPELDHSGWYSDSDSD